MTYDHTTVNSTVQEYPIHAAQRGFAIAGTFAEDKWAPYVQEAFVQNVKDGTGEIWAEVEDDQSVLFVSAIVYPPDYEAASEGGELVSSPLPVGLVSQGNHHYAISYQSFSKMGEYRIVIYAQDNEGLQARPQEVTVRTGWQLFLPAITR